MWRANGNPNPCTDLDEILHVHPHLSKESFGAHLNPTALPLGPRGPKTLKLKDTLFTLLRCSAGCKLTRAAPGTSASMYIKQAIVPYLSSSFTHEQPDQSPPNFAQTSPSTLERFLTQVWPRQIGHLTLGSPKLQNLSRSLENKLYLPWIQWW